MSEGATDQHGKAITSHHIKNVITKKLEIDTRVTVLGKVLSQIFVEFYVVFLLAMLLLLLLPDPFRGMGAWRKTMEPQKPGNPPGPEPKVVGRQTAAKE